MKQNHIAVRSFRLFTLAITGFYFLYLSMLSDFSTFGWQFRFLTIWGLTASLISAIFMVRLSFGLSAKRHDVWVSTTVVLNAVVVLMYWKIYFTDPSLFYGDDAGSKMINHRELFIHGIGPALQAFDALFLFGAFQRFKRTLMAVAVLPCAYVLWAELIVGPLNSKPVGEVTTGLPYLFLNDMVFVERAEFYATTVMTMLVLFLALAGVAWLLRALGITRVSSGDFLRK